jgi:hypothetical protein
MISKRQVILSLKRKLNSQKKRFKPLLLKLKIQCLHNPKKDY